MKYISKLTVVVSCLMVLAVAMIAVPAYAADDPAKAACLGSGGEWTEDNRLPNGGKCSQPGTANDRSLFSFIVQVANILIFIVGTIAVLMAIIGGLRYAVAQGDQQAISAAKNTILYAIVGIVVAFSAFAITNFFAESLKDTPPAEDDDSTTWWYNTDINKNKEKLT